MTVALLIAHVGHWWMWAIYAVPVLVVLAASVHALLEQRREDRERRVVGD